MKHFISRHWLVAAALVVGIPSLSKPAPAQVVSLTYDLNNVRMSSGALMTGTFQWTYTVGDFENGTGQFVTYSIPGWSSSYPALQATIDTGSIEFSMIGNYHGFGMDLTLHLQDPLSPSQPATLDLVRSKYQIEVGTIRTGTFFSGSVDPRCAPPSNYGSGTAGSGGFVPTIGTSGGDPSLGNAAFGVSCDQMLGGAGCLLLLGSGQTQIPIVGVTILVDPAAWVTVGFQATGTPGVAGAGSLQVPVPIPSNPQFVGAEIDFQVLIVDPSTAMGLAATDGLSVTICNQSQ